MSKNRVIVEAVLAGRSHAAVAEQYGISKVWVGTLMAHWRTCGLKSIHWQCGCPHQNGVAAPRRIQQPLLPFSNSETGEAPRKVRLGSKGNHLKVNKVPGQGLTMSRDLTMEPPRGTVAKAPPHPGPTHYERTPGWGYSFSTNGF